MAGAAAALTDAVEALTPAAVSFRRSAARSGRPRRRLARSAGVRRHAAADALHRARRVDDRHDRQLGGSSRDAVGRQHRAHRGLSRATCATRSSRGSRWTAAQAETGLGGMHRVRERRDRRVDDDQPRRRPWSIRTRGSRSRSRRTTRRARSAAGWPRRRWPPCGRAARRWRRPSRGSRFAARTLELPIDNTLFRLANALGLFGRGQPRLNHIRSEVAVVTFGDASVTCVPGELYPEIANGGIEHPPGADFDVAPGGGAVAAGADARPGEVPDRARQRRSGLHHPEVRVGRRGAVALRQRPSGTTARSTRSARRRRRRFTGR